MSKNIILLFLVALAASQQGSLQVMPTTTTLFTASTYTFSYYTMHPMPSNATITLDFTNTYIEVPNATMNATGAIQGAQVSGVTAVCASLICTLKMNNAVNQLRNMSITFGLLKNPYFKNKQTISSQVQFNNSYT
mgnify:CR=1 FL=1